MPKGFSEKEKREIKEKIIETGKMLFSQYGLKKTSVEDITTACRIGKGSFYLFYSSKEELYVEIIAREERKIHNYIIERLSESKESILYALKLLLIELFKRIQEDNLYMSSIEQGYLHRIWNSSLEIGTENRNSFFLRDIMLSKKIFEILNKNGIISKVNPEEFTGITRGLFLLMVHKDIIGDDYYDKVINIYIDSIFDNIFVEKDNL